MASNNSGSSGTCGACQQAIYGPHLVAFGMQWHADHLLCYTCHSPFLDGRVFEGMDGFAYCEAHWKEKFLPICPTCNKGIEGPTINALNKSFHPTCFKCKMCSADLTGQFFPSPQGDPLCEKDYYDALGLICGGCQKPIVAGKVITMAGQNGAKDVKFHIEHFQCSYCKKGLAGEKYKQRKGKPYCMSDFIKLFE